jgi:hypothetical protein
MVIPLPTSSKPIVNEDKIAINDRFYAHYCLYIDGQSFYRPRNAWYKYTQRNFVTPTINPQLANPYNEGVLFDCYEHVSVCIGGSSNYTLKRHQYGYDANGSLISDVVGNITYEWVFGDHNVENGLGYLPSEEFTRIFNSNYETCCILPVIENTVTDPTYNFEVVKLNNSSHVLNRNIKFAHIAFGNVSINGSNYAQKQNVMDLINGTTISSTENSIVILGYIVE